MPQTKLAVVDRAAPAPPTDWHQREKALLDRRREIAADIGELEGGRIRLQVALAGSPDPRINTALAKFREQAAALRSEQEDVEAALAVVGEHRAAEAATANAREREVKRAALGLLLDRRARAAATVDALLAGVEVAFAELRASAPAITHMAYDLGLGDLPGFSGPAEETSVKAALCAQAPTLARILGIHVTTWEPGQRHPLAATEAHRGTGVDRRIADGRAKDEAAAARVEQQAEVTRAARAARAA